MLINAGIWYVKPVNILNVKKTVRGITRKNENGNGFFKRCQKVTRAKLLFEQVAVNLGKTRMKNVDCNELLIVLCLNFVSVTFIKMTYSQPNCPMPCQMEPRDTPH